MADHNVNILLKARDDASGKIRGLAKAAIGLGAAFLSFRAISGFVRSSTEEAFLRQEAAANQLSNALALLNAQAQTGDMLKFASQIQKRTVFGDEAVAEVMSLGASMGKLAGQDLKAATVAAIGLSKAFNMDVMTAMTLISKAAQGNTAAMSRYGIVFKEGMTAQEKFNQVLAIGQEKFALATGETQTFGGRLKQLGNAFGDAKEQVGQMIASIPGLVTGMAVLKTVFENFKLTMEIVFTSTALLMVQVWERMKHTFWATGQLLIWLADNWKQIFETLWSFTKSIFVGMFENIKNFFIAVWGWLKGEGFDFKWTGLLEGFESTLQELPAVFKRNIGPVEAALAAELEGLKGQFKEKLGVNMQPGQAPGIGGGGMTGTAAAGAAGKVAAVESRFMGGSGRSAIDYARETAGQNKRQTELLARIEQKIGALNTVKNAIADRETSFI
jgi:hypothetical protein